MKRILQLGVFLFYSLLPSVAQSITPMMAEGLIQAHDLFNASDNPDIACYRIPAIVTATNGDLVVAIDERVPSCQDLRGSRDINIVIRRSQDHGHSWSDIERVVDFPEGKSASDPSMIVDEITGEIILFYNYMDLDQEKDIYYLHVVKSKDHGLHLFGSDDHGQSWYLIDTPIKPGDESKVVELTDGRWMINSRANEKGKRFVHISSDHGLSWESRPEPELIDPGCNGSIIRLSSIKEGHSRNRLLFSNAKMKKGRQNLTVRISYDEGLTWSEGKCIYPGSAAYSSMTVLENGHIGLIFEKDFHTENLFVSFSLEWLTDGEDHWKEPEIK